MATIGVIDVKLESYGTIFKQTIVESLNSYSKITKKLLTIESLEFTNF